MLSADKYSDLSGIDSDNKKPVFYAHDSSCCTLLKIDGTTTIISPQEFEEKMVNLFANPIGTLFKNVGHHISVSYENSLNTDLEIEELLSKQKKNAEQKGLNVDALIDEAREILQKKARSETILIACWTRINIGNDHEIKREVEAQRKKWFSLPPTTNAQNPYLSIKTLEAPHESFVARIIDTLKNVGISIRSFTPESSGIRQDLAEIRKALFYHETPADWRPIPPGSLKYPQAKENINTDMGSIFSPTLARQLLTSNAQASNDLRTISMGGRQYALAVVRVFQTTLTDFNNLLSKLADPNSNVKVPFRICYSLEPLDPKYRGLAVLKQIISGIVKTGDNNKIFNNIRDTLKYEKNQKEVIIKIRVTATTWIEPGEDATLLETRRSYLLRSLSTWGDMIVTDAPFDPMRCLCETVPGLTIDTKVAPAALAPLSDVSLMLPFHRPARIFPSGYAVYLSREGKIMPFEAFSPLMQYWFSIYVATPGSGKSVSLNRSNFEYAAFQPGADLPFLGIIDVGVSSSGLVELIKNSLPLNRKHEAVYVRLANDKMSGHHINPFDTSLGSRQPLYREKVFISNFLVVLLALEGAVGDQIVENIITKIYNMKSDLVMGNKANIYQHGENNKIDQILEEKRISVPPKTTWWSLCDEMMLAGDYLAAEICHRHAMPVLDDVATVLSEEHTVKDYTHEEVRKALRSLEFALNKYPLFSRPTSLDFKGARVISLDIDVVLNKSYQTAEAQRNNALMFMIARQAFLANISGFIKEIPSFSFPPNRNNAPLEEIYIQYWTNKFKKISETPKRLCMDEFHVTGAGTAIRKQVETDVREGRKWRLEIILASQLLKDFYDLAAMSSSLYVMNSDSEEHREQLKDTFAFSNAVKRELELYCHGPRGSQGANMLVRVKQNEQERWALINNTIGPRMLWALTTKNQDMQVRNALFNKMSTNEALTILAHFFPEGSALDVWEKTEAELTSSQSIAEHIATDLINRSKVSRH